MHQKNQCQEWKFAEMKKLLEIASIALMVVGAALLFERQAYAYADPGTGLLAIQAVGSALVASGWYLRKKIYSLLHRGGATGRQVDEVSATKEDEGASTL
jgi:O-antigen/teichoic acid export membrane protein